MKTIPRKYIRIALVITLIILSSIGILPTSEDSSNQQTPTTLNEIKQTSSELEPNNSLTREKTKVIRVIDGDTIEVTGNLKVRYIGIDTPEISGSKLDCYGTEATSKNKELVLGKEIEMEKDVSETDRYGRLLRYIYVDGQMINETLVKEGFAKVATFPPDVKNKDVFITAEQEARNNSKGLWGNVCNKPKPDITIPPPIY